MNTPFVIHDSPMYKLEGMITPIPGELYNLELFAIWPKANHPFSRRLVQLNLTAQDLGRLVQEIHNRVPLCNQFPQGETTCLPQT